jgi:hypothetical protein
MRDSYISDGMTNIEVRYSIVKTDGIRDVYNNKKLVEQNEIISNNVNVVYVVYQYYYYYYAYC